MRFLYILDTSYIYSFSNHLYDIYEGKSDPVCMREDMRSKDPPLGSEEPDGIVNIVKSATIWWIKLFTKCPAHVTMNEFCILKRKSS